MKTKYILLLLTAFAVTTFTSCKDTLDLDDETLIAIEKQEKLKQLDELFQLAFTDPVKAEKDYYQFYTTELLTDDQNFLMDNDVRMHSTFADLAVRLNMKFEKMKGEVSTTSLFDIYKAKFESALFNKTLMGEIPQQVRKGVKLDKFENKVAEISAFFDGKISDFKSKPQTDAAIMGKQWKGVSWIYPPDFSWIKIASYDFNFKGNGTLDINDFFLTPLITMKGIQTIEEPTSFPEGVRPSLLSEVEYTIYQNKILLWLQLAYDPQPGSLKFNRQYCYEYDYHVEGDQLILSNPHIMLYMHPFLYVSGYGEPNYELNYMEAYREPITLNAN